MTSRRQQQAWQLEQVIFDVGRSFMVSSKSTEAMVDAFEMTIFLVLALTLVLVTWHLVGT